MEITEKSRHDLHAKLEQVLGPERAATLMGMLPPVGWADVATKRDLDQLALMTKRDLDRHADMTRRDLDELSKALNHHVEMTRRDLQSMEHKLVAAFRGEMAAQTRTILFALVGILVPYAGVIFAAARLA